MYQFPVVNLGGDSSRARHSKHGNPILKCRRCAKEEEERKKREMGCGYEPAPEIELPDETSEATLDLGCDKCQDKRRKKKKVTNTSIMPSGMLSLQGQTPMFRQVPLAPSYPGAWPNVMGNGGRGGRAFTYDHDRGYYPQYPGDDGYCDPATEICPIPLVAPRMEGQVCPGHAALGQGCPAGAVPLDPTLNCQRDARGNAVCSNGLYFPPGCPKTPPEEYFSPGIAPDEVHGTILEAKVPPARGTPGAPPLVGGGSAPSTPGAPAASGSANILPYAAGGIAVAGLLYALLR